MLDIKNIRKNPQQLDQALASRGMAPLSQELLQLDGQLQANQKTLQSLHTQKNELAKMIGQAKQQAEGIGLLRKLAHVEEFEEGPEHRTDRRTIDVHEDPSTGPTYKLPTGVEFPEKSIATYLEQANSIKEKIPALEEKILLQEVKLQAMLDMLPNIPLPEVPIAADETGNVIVKQFGEIPAFAFTPQDHCSLGENLGILDFASASAMSGSRFVLMYRELARMERALANFMLDIHTKQFGYTEVVTPLLVLEKAMYGVGQLPKFSEESFSVDDKFRLIPTAEVPLTNLVADKIIAEEDLPLRYTAYSSCFRSEAGSAGRDTRGMIRQHQFSKVELVSITRPQDAEQEHQRMLSAAEEVLKQLELPYQVALLATGDMGFSSSKTYDIEVWLPSQNRYREISSCSNCGDFQARRLKSRYKERHSGKNILVHTLNGSALAVGRTMVAILECYQNADGSISIPKNLRPYMDNMEKIG